MNSRGSHDFCRDCGDALNLRDSWWGNCISHRDEQRTRISEACKKIHEALDEGKPLKGKPSKHQPLIDHARRLREDIDG